MPQEKMTERIVTVVITLVVAGVIGVIGSALGGGALIEALGGVQETDPILAKRVAALEGKTDRVITKEIVDNTVDTKISEAIATLTDKIASLGTVSIPRGVVVALDRDDLTADKCPSGWQPFKEARARVIVGAGDPSKAPGKYGYDEVARPLTHYVRGQHRGEEKHALTEKEMPEHDHKILLSSVGQPRLVNSNVFETSNQRNAPLVGNSGKRHPYSINVNVTTSKYGARTPKAINNMPPYIALYFCKKS